MCLLQNPAADVAAQAAAALAMSARVALDHGTPQDQKVANSTWAPKAVRAYAYAKNMWQKYGNDSSCTNSGANDNCIGSGCLKDTVAVYSVRL